MCNSDRLTHQPHHQLTRSLHHPHLHYRLCRPHQRHRQRRNHPLQHPHHPHHQHHQHPPPRHRRRPRHLPAAHTEETPEHPLNLTAARTPTPTEHEPTGATRHTSPRVRAHGERNGTASTPPPARAALPYTAPQHRSHTVPPLPPTGHALQPTARGTTTTTFSRPSNTY